MKDMCEKDKKISQAMSLREQAEKIEKEAKQPVIDILNIMMMAANEQPADGQPPQHPKMTELQNTIRDCIDDFLKIEGIEQADLEAIVGNG